MNDQINQIAERIKGLRGIASLSPEGCAREMGISADPTA